MFTKKPGLFLIALLLIMGCASLKPILPAPTDVNTPLPSSPTAGPILEQISTGTAIPPSLPADLPSINATTQIQLTPKVPWNIYHSYTYGFSFAYPSTYDDPQYQSCSPRFVEQANGTEFSLGRQSFLTVQKKGDLDIQTYVNDLVTQKQAESAWTLESQNSKMAGGEEAIEVNYRFGGTNRFGTATFLNHRGLLLTFNFSAGVFCDVPEIALTEGQVYAQWIDSLRFDE